MPSTTPRPSARLGHFFLGSAALLFWLLLDLLPDGLDRSPGASVRAYAFAVAATYAVVYLLPALALTLLARASVALLARARGRRAWMDTFVRAVAVLAATVTALVLLADRDLYRLYGFHLNGFVWNLATTRGGLASLGTSASTVRSLVLLASGCLLLHLAWMWLCGRTVRPDCVRFVPGRRSYRALGALFLVLALGERVAYGISEVRAYTPILAASDAFPFYGRLTFRSLAARLGFESQREPSLELAQGDGNLRYPLAPLEVRPPSRPLNVVWLVAESLRADALTPEIMPQSSAFAARALRAPQHYSGGNGTRMGMFSMFYGLHGAYWFSFLRERRGPVLMDVLAEQGYQWRMFTSAHFSYPEFDKTVFARVPAEHLHEDASGAEWERDRRNVTRLLDFVAERDPARPFFTFLFFESPHARYHFPPESVIREPYLEDFNYATADLEHDIERIRNRYLNACHHLDSQWGRVLAYLEREQLLEDTLVILTGDHGEEFMEHGRWGHNSEFVEQQVRVPLVLWVPGQAARELSGMTGHVDLTATVLPLLGVVSPAADYTLGRDLLGDVRRPFQALSDWSRIGFVDEEAKLGFALKSSGLFRQHATTRDDAPLELSVVLQAKQGELLELMRELGRFRDTGASELP